MKNEQNFISKSKWNNQYSQKMFLCDGIFGSFTYPFGAWNGTCIGISIFAWFSFSRLIARSDLNREFDLMFASEPIFFILLGSLLTFEIELSSLASINFKVFTFFVLSYWSSGSFSLRNFKTPGHLMVSRSSTSPSLSFSNIWKTSSLSSSSAVGLLSISRVMHLLIMLASFLE